MDYKNIVLTKHEFKQLKRLNKNSTIYFSKTPSTTLLMFSYQVHEKREKGQLMGKPTGNYRINDDGIRYLVYLRSKKIEKILKNIREWITTVIAVLGFILAVISLIWQSQKQ